MTAPPPVTDAGWESEARRLEPLVDGLSAVVLVGSDPVAVAEVAVELGRAQAVRRRVTIGDLVGDLPALERLIAHHDPHGLSDTLTYGVSLARVGYPVIGVDNLFIAPSGTEPVGSESILAHPRWRRLVAGERARGALLMLVADPAAPGLDRLIEATDGAIVVGDSLVPPGPVIARTPPRGARRVPTPRIGAFHPPPFTPVSSNVEPNTSTGGPASGVEAPEQRPIWRRIPRRVIAIAAVAGVAGVVTAVLVAGGRDEQSDATLPPTAPAADPPPPVENPAAEGDAAAYSLVLRTANTPAGANDNLQRLVDLPAATMAPSLDDDAGLWYKVFAGAYADRAQAESLRAALHASGRVAENLMSLAFLPFALLVADSVGIDSATVVTAGFRAQGIPAYALVQKGGGTRIFAGAFATPQEAMHMAPVLRAAGVQPRIAYRTGRPQ